jgi:hypothetical protein
MQVLERRLPLGIGHLEGTGIGQVVVGYGLARGIGAAEVLQGADHQQEDRELTDQHGFHQEQLDFGDDERDDGRLDQEGEDQQGNDALENVVLSASTLKIVRALDQPIRGCRKNHSPWITSRNTVGSK